MANFALLWDSLLETFNMLGENIWTANRSI